MLKGAAILLCGVIVISAVIIGATLRAWLNDTSPKPIPYRANQIKKYERLIQDLKDPEGSITLTRDDLPVALLTSMFEDHQDFNDHIFLPLESRQLRDKAALYKQLDEDFKEVNIDSHEIAARAYLEAHGFDE